MNAQFHICKINLQIYLSKIIIICTLFFFVKVITKLFKKKNIQIKLFFVVIVQRSEEHQN